MTRLQDRSGNAGILVLNCGSSSVKFALFTDAHSPRRFWSGSIDRIGVADTRFHIADAQGTTVIDQADPIADHEAALAQVLDTIDRHAAELEVAAVGHRIVHGGTACDCPVIITQAVEAYLQRLVPLAPLHQPHNLAGIEAIRSARPALPQVACFDTSFHHGLPRLATLTALPKAFFSEGIRRFGFHGLSYEYIVDALRRSGTDVDHERAVIAHLGNGASMCAVKDGRSIETTMGFSTLAGLPMGTRCGDLDPGIVLYLFKEGGMTAERIEHLLYEESGLLGVSGVTSNMEDLLRRTSDQAALEAVEVFCYQARRHLAALTGTLGGLDRVVFTGGIGANASFVREKICDGLQYLDLKIDTARNISNNSVISTNDSRVAVQALPTDEELMIARHVRQVLAAQPAASREA